MRHIPIGILLTPGSTASAQSPPPRVIGSTGTLASTRSQVHATERAVPLRARPDPAHASWSDDATGANTLVPDDADAVPR